jgi:hypothetical protein
VKGDESWVHNFHPEGTVNGIASQQITSTHTKKGRLQHLLAKLCTQFSAMLRVWCIQKVCLVAQPLTLRGNVKQWESWKYDFKEFIATCSSLYYSMTVLDHTQVQEQMQRCDTLVSPWITHHIV